MKRLFKKFIHLNLKVSDKLSGIFKGFFSGGDYEVELLDFIQAYLDRSGKKINLLEVGGNNRPMLQKQKSYFYIGLDIEDIKNPEDIYDKFIVQSIESDIPGKYDLIISMTLLEHVPDNGSATHSMHKALDHDGVVAHYMPSKYHPYSLILRLVGPRLQRWLIAHLRPSLTGVAGYPAYFNHCSPMSMAKLMKKTGYKDIRISCFYRANEYFKFFVPFYIIITIYENICNLFGLKQLCSGFIVTANK